MTAHRAAPNAGAGGGRPVRPRDVVFTFSFETLDDARRRGMMRPPDRLLERLIADERVGGLLVAEPYRSAPVQLLRAVTRRRRPVDGVEVDIAPDRVFRPRRLRRHDPRALPAIEATYRRYDEGLHHAADAHGMVDPAVITCHPLIAGFAPLAWASQVTYYARDDWASHPDHRRLWPAYEEAYARLRERRRAVCAVSEVLLSRIAPTGPARVVPNGIDRDEWARPIAAGPDWFEALSHPRFVYAGSLDDRIDVEAVERLADAMPDASVVLVGPQLDPGHLAELERHPNVTLHRSVGRAELIAILFNADVGIVPHRRTPLTQAMSPLKVYEYLAAGRPVVATDLAPMRGLSDRVVLVEPGGDWTEPARRALARGPADEADRLAFVAANSWDQRHRELLDIALAETG